MILTCNNVPLELHVPIGPCMSPLEICLFNAIII